MIANRRARAIATCVALLCVLAAFSPAPQTAGAGAPVLSGTLTVFAAASLTEAFTLLGKVLEQRHPEQRVFQNFAGSQQLAVQIEQGARADVFGSADQRWMEYVEQRGLLGTKPVVFARNRLVVIIPRANSAQITRLQDLARPRLKVVLAADAVPAGRYSREALDNLSRAPGFDRDFSARVLRNVVSQEENVRGVIAKVQLGEADAGMVYRSDVTAGVADRVQILNIPDRYNVLASYPIAVLRSASNLAAATTFVALVQSSLGQRVLRDHQFITAVEP